MPFKTLCCLLLAVASAAPVDDQSHNDPRKCADALIAWCKDMKYPNTKNSGTSISSTTIAHDHDYYQATCITDYQGTNCTRNGSPWFACSRDNEFLYKSKPLNDADLEPDICRTARAAFRDLSVKGMSFDEAAFEKSFNKSMASFRRAMEDMNTRMSEMTRRLSNMFGDGFPFGNKGSSSKRERERE